VKGDTPIIDGRDAGRGGRFTREALDRVPTRRSLVVVAQTQGSR